MTNVLKKLIGYGYTDSNGIATLDYTEDGTDITTLQPTGETGYIGNGVGSVQVGAEIHDNSILVSQQCTVLDALFYDKGDNTNWYNGGGFTVTPSTSDGKLLTVDTPSTATLDCNTTTSTKYNFNKNVCIEFDVISASGTPRFYVRNGSNRPFKQIPNGDSHIKVTIDGTNVVWDINGTISSLAFAVDNFYCYFKGETASTSFTIANFKVYPI